MNQTIAIRLWRIARRREASTSSRSHELSTTTRTAVPNAAAALGWWMRVGCFELMQFLHCVSLSNNSKAENRKSIIGSHSWYCLRATTLQTVRDNLWWRLRR
jgi:hypothetical protein